MDEAYGRLISFDSVHQAIKAEKAIGNLQKRYLMIPTPRQIDVSCGQSILILAEDEDEILAELKAAKVRWEKLFSRDDREASWEKIMDFER